MTQKTPMRYSERAAELLAEALKTRSFIEEYAKSTNRNKLLRAKALLITTQLELLASYLILLENPYGKPLIGRAVIIRAVMDHQANSLHIGTSLARATKYLDYTETMHRRINQTMNELTEGKAHKVFEEPSWTSSSIRDRVKLISNVAPLAYDAFSDFVHGNNVPDFYNQKDLHDSFEDTMNRTFILLLMGALTDIGSSFTEDLVKLGIHEEILESLDKDKKIELRQ